MDFSGNDRREVFGDAQVSTLQVFNQIYVASADQELGSQRDDSNNNIDLLKSSYAKVVLKKLDMISTSKKPVRGHVHNCITGVFQTSDLRDSPIAGRNLMVELSISVTLGSADKGIFIIQSESLKKCIQAGKSVLTLENCKPPNKHMLWKWVSNHRLFNIGGSGCLGLNLSNPEQPLSVYECDSTHISLRWLCNRNMLTGPLKYTVQVNHNNMLVASWKYLHKWISYMSDGGSICEYLHKDLYTIKGNAHGTPCMFPFQYNRQWHHECIREGHLLWCATTSRYERDEKWGFCPDPTSAEVGCDAIWEKDLNSHICYQFNLLSSLSWNEAHYSCQMQGGALLSIADENEENFIKKHLGSEAVEMWTGLNQLDENAGWQWSDRTPLNYLNWNPEIDFEPFVEYQCGTFNSFMPNAWRSRDCESALPYICKKYLNHTDQEEIEKGAWKYYATHCEPGWNPHSRNCYKLQKEKKTWKEALHSCQSDNSTLINIASLADVEFLVTLLGDENASETWIGLSSNKIPVSFEWSNGSSVTFTNWHTLEPQIFPNRSQQCVSAEQSEGHWKVKNCEETLFYICKKAGHVPSDTESGCREGWERHGGFCYKIDTVLRSFDHASSGYYCPPALVTITNRFEQAFITSLISSVVKTKDSYFWIALQDQNDTGEYTWKTAGGQKSEPVQYTHWNAHQPRYNGGCVVMRGRSPPGRWEVKDCRHFKAMSLCKQPVGKQEKTEQEERWPFHPCYLDWESEPGLASCFKVFHSEKVLMKRTWREAEAFCEEFGAHLASFAHIEEENFVNELLHSKFNRTEERQFWIGFNKRNPLNAGSWEWSDGTPVVSSFLDNTYFGEDARNCAVYKANKTLLSLHCSSKREWICKIPRDVRPKIPPWYQYDAPWLFYQDAEYLFHTYAAEWPSFEFVCGWLRGDLLTIHSAHEQEFIHSKIRALSKYGVNWWIGLRDERANDEFRWRDGAPVIYQNWDKGRERSMNNQSQRCGFISSITGLWASEECSVSMPSICKRKKIWVIEKEKDTPKQHGTCPRGWLYFNYKFPPQNGLNFDWSDGTKSSFTFWKDDESSILGDCVFADTSGRWSSTACESFLQGAICHVPTETKPYGHPELCSETSIPWIKFKSNCYSFSTVLDSMSFEAAHEFCKKEGSNLLTIKDEDENSFLLEELFAFGSSVQMVWLNAQFDGDNETTKWFDGTPTDQSNWGIRKPEMDHVKPHLCIALRIPEGVWQLSPCQEKKGFICKMGADIHPVKEHSGKGPSHSIVPLAVALTLTVILALFTLSFCIYKHNRGIFRRLAQFRNPYYPTANFSTVHLEENILICDLEKNDQQQ
ncbi:secretory phospholipase A2 receptor [Leptonychotes weddellii]|uniref:Secretory phospholipase A2 receptor n=1 Tax=Leptonychotes weddellii TaxID=9713 RepID=A0A7F8RUZ7_LEPWE|nr:secretory phospholipase A2 receptor [Leptonychotes weddellii]